MTVGAPLEVIVNVYVSAGQLVPSQLQYTPNSSRTWKRPLLVKPVAAPLIDSVTDEFGAIAVDDERRSVHAPAPAVLSGANAMPGDVASARRRAGTDAAKSAHCRPVTAA